MRDQTRLPLSLTDLQAAKDQDELKPAFYRICARYGLSHMTLLVVRNGIRSIPYPYFCTTYPMAWIDTYLAKSFVEIDPANEVIRWGLQPVDWSSLDQSSPEVDQFFEEAHSYGVGPHGLTVPVRGPQGERSLFSVSSDLPGHDWARLCASSRHDLHILSYYLHEKVFAITGLRDAAGHRRLSRRETQCLHLLASGKIYKQIAAALEISESSVRLYLRSARNKLGASTSHQAVAKASFLELITF